MGYFSSCRVVSGSPLMLNFLVLLVLGHAALSHSNMIDAKVLNVGKELKKEILPLHMGSCVYQLQGLQSDK